MSEKFETSSANSMPFERERRDTEEVNACSPCDDPDLLDAFRVFDKDGDGFISPEELNATLSYLGFLPPSASLSRVRSMIRRVDTDGDGHVNFKEFQTMMKDSDMS
ncbi:hypothetical protein KP509_11G088600 [Ceratopteris richardii]|nr:hypothetical protein KP509_11G088600 [Ceratopteris richardii]